MKFKSVHFSIRYEYLDFGDEKGNRRFSGKVGHSKWPMKVRFEGTSAINFTYSNAMDCDEAAGYNFKVNYKLPLLWIFNK